MRWISITLFFFFLSSCDIKSQQTSSRNSQEIDNTIHNIYNWKENTEVKNKIVNRVETPLGFQRVETTKNSFADWLRNIPLKTGNPKVLLYNGNKKGNQATHAAVLDIDIGTKDLQQCADAVMRLRAEYLYSTSQRENISFNFTSGDACSYSKWSKGFRPKISKNIVQFLQSNKPEDSYESFKKYLQTIFMYCGTYSLEKSLNEVLEINTIKAGDVFIQGGFPGHAIIVMDVAINIKSQEKIFLLAQSYMPAQNIHLLKNPNNKELSPWFSVNFDEKLETPEWIFDKKDLKRF